eukprot:TRINITY_DN23684_c0_g1_i1.p1 TRINITY_DN23684_c0_g1~~TRINITY_DN23684_c0_g1_i1.p1  ORF type:complete len:586 (+),score=61.47 TRINITY_DN23684_c0_g1_i1:112-1869(+)
MIQIDATNATDILLSMFDNLDENGNGRIDSDNIYSYADNCPTLQSFCCKADLDDDGVITRREWVTHVIRWMDEHENDPELIQSMVDAAQQVSPEAVREKKRKMRALRTADKVWDNVLSDGDDEKDGVIMDSCLKGQHAEDGHHCRLLQVGQKIVISVKSSAYLCEIVSVSLERDYPYKITFIEDDAIDDTRCMICVSTSRVMAPLWRYGKLPFELVDDTEEISAEEIVSILERGELPRAEQLLHLIGDVRALCKAHPALVTVPADASEPVAIFGDIHGNFHGLRLFTWALGYSPYDCSTGAHDVETEKMSLKKLPAHRLLFLGDLVDRGTQNVEVIALVLAWMMMYPDRVTVLRGNHEDENMNSRYGFVRECEEKFGPAQGKIVFRHINNLFNYLPCAAVVGGELFCCHGGIGPSIGSLEDIAELQEEMPLALEVPPETKEQTILQDLMWADPVEDGEVEVDEFGFAENDGRQMSVFWSKKASDKFLEATGLQMIVRGHECRQEGFDYCHDGMVLTIFSSPAYSDFNCAAVFMYEGFAHSMRHWRIGPDFTPVPPLMNFQGNGPMCMIPRKRGGHKKNCEACCIS